MDCERVEVRRRGRRWVGDNEVKDERSESYRRDKEEGEEGVLGMSGVLF